LRWADFRGASAGLCAELLSAGLVPTDWPIGPWGAGLPGGPALRAGRMTRRRPPPPGPGDAGPGDAGPGDAGPGDAGPGDAGPEAEDAPPSSAPGIPTRPGLAYRLACGPSGATCDVRRPPFNADTGPRAGMRGVALRLIAGLVAGLIDGLVDGLMDWLMDGLMDGLAAASR